MDLNEIRMEIDAVDRQLLSLFVKRMDLCSEVARYKIAHDLPVFRPEREKVILERVEKEGSPYGEEAVRLFEVLMSLSKERQEALITLEKQKP